MRITAKTVWDGSIGQGVREYGSMSQHVPTKIIVGMAPCSFWGSGLATFAKEILMSWNNWRRVALGTGSKKILSTFFSKAEDPNAPIFDLLGLLEIRFVLDFFLHLDFWEFPSRLKLAICRIFGEVSEVFPYPACSFSMAFDDFEAKDVFDQGKWMYHQTSGALSMQKQTLGLV